MPNKFYLGIVAAVACAFIGVLIVVIIARSGDDATADNAAVPAQSAVESESPAADATSPVASNVESSPPAPASPPVSSAPNLTGLPDSSLRPDQVADLRKKLRQIAIAFHNYHDTRKEFPPGQKQAANPNLSWRVQLLPFMEQQPLYERFHLNEAWDSPHNQALLDLMPDIYRAGDETGSNTHFVVFVGDKAFFRPKMAPRIQQCSDGTSNTLLAVHTGGGKAVPWTKPEDAAFDESRPAADMGLINGRIEGVLFDVTPISLPAEVDLATFAGLVTPRGSELIDGAGLARRYAQTAATSAIPSGASAQSSQVGVDIAMRAVQQRAKDVAVAMLNTGSMMNVPPAVSYRVRGAERSPGMSWRVRILPYLDQRNLYRAYKPDLAWDDGENRALLDKMPSAYSFDLNAEKSLTRIQVFRGEGTPFGKTELDTSSSEPPRGLDMRKISGGRSRTIMFVESGKDRAVPWTQPRDLDFDPETPIESMGQLEPTGTVAAMFDGSVRVIHSDIDPAVFRSLVMMQSEPKPTLAQLPVAPRSVPGAQATADLSTPASIDASTGQAPAKEFAQPDQIVFPFARPGLHSAYDTASGHLMVAEYDHNHVTLYKLDAGLTALRQIPSPARPCAVLAKRFKDKSYFLVGGALDKRIDIFAAESGERANSIHIQTPTILRLAASQSPDDPYVYYISKFGPQQRQYVGRINLETNTDEGFIQEGDYLVVSSDGSALYMSLMAPSSNIHVTSLRVVNRPPEGPRDSDLPPANLSVERINDYWYNPTQLAVGPSNTFIGVQTNIFPTTLRDSLGSLEFPILAFSSTKPWAAGIEKGIFQVASVNDKRTIAKIRLTKEFNHAPIISDRVKDQFKQHLTRLDQVTPMFFDDPRQRIIVATEDRIAVFSWKGIGLTDEPLVAVDCPAEVAVVAGNSLEIPLRPFDEKITVRLASAPRGATYAEGKLRWAPTAADLGKGTFLIESSFGPLRYEQTIDVRVTRPSIALPFACKYVSLSPDGKLAVVWAQSDYRDQNDFVPPGKLALVDLANNKVLGAKEVPNGIWVARVNQQGVFVLSVPPRNANPNLLIEVFRLNLADLSVGARSSAAGNSRILDLAGEKFLVACEEMFSLPDLIKLSTYVNPNRFDNNRQQQLQPMMTRIDEGWFADGVVWDEQLAQAQMLINPRGIARPHQGNEQAFDVVSWGMQLHGSQLIAPPNSVIIQSRDDGRKPMVLREIPAAIIGERAWDGGGSELFNIAVHDVAGGAKTQSIPLTAKVPSPTSQYERREASPPLEFDAAGDVIAVCADSELIVVPLKEIDRELLNVPFRFRWLQNPLILAGKNAKATYEIVGGVPPFDVKLSIDGIESRAQTQNRSVLPIDALAITEKVLLNVNNFNWSIGIDQNESRGTAKDFKERIVDYVDVAAPHYKALTGRNPNGVPVLVPAIVEASDRNLKTTRLMHYYLLDLPVAHVVLRSNSGDYGRGSASLRGSRRATLDDDRTTKADNASRAERVAEVNRKLAIEYGNELRQDFPSEAIDSDTLKTKAAAARDSANGYLTQSVNETRAAKLRGMRTWSDKKNHQTKAELKSQFADQVVLKLATGNEVTVPIEKLSKQDQEFLSDSQQSEASPLELVVARMKLLGQGMDTHRLERNGNFPPAFIASAEGKPLLSWRVAILPHIGGKELFALFHLDEPWDSEHNRALLPFMPSFFAPADRGIAPNRTTLLSFRNPRSLLADGRPKSAAEVVDGYENVGVVGEVVPRRAVEWTRPEDIPVRSVTILKSWLKERGGAYLVGFVGGKVQAVPAAMPQRDWLKVIDYKDRAVLELQSTDPFALPDSGRPARDAPAAPPASSNNSQTVPRKSRNSDLSVPENARAGTVVGKATGAPAGYTYRIPTDRGGVPFAVHPTTGVITVKNARRLDAELVPSYVFQVVAENSRGEQVPVFFVPPEQSE